jgi:NitT/TauT family transport system substrate-binding protein
MNLKPAMTLALMACALLAAACKPAPPAPPPPLRLHGFLESLEIAPVLLAADEHYPHTVTLHRGGIANLVGKVTSNYGEPGNADIATNAETQLLRHSVGNPGLRVIMTVTEGRYRIVARRSAGIQKLADLAGKRVGTMSNTSAGYFLERMLGSVRLRPADVTILGDIDLPQLSNALIDGRIDALAMWSPETEEAELALGADAVAFPGDGVYREIFSINSTATALADPARRAAIKHFLRALVDASEAIARDPGPALGLVTTRMADYPPAVVAAAWPHHRYLAGKVPDLLEVMVEEEQWLARVDKRAARSREALASLIDYSLLDELATDSAR